MSTEFDDIQDHQIRLIVFSNGLILIAKVVSYKESVISVIFPFEVGMRLGEGGLVEYELVPYLENLIDFNLDQTQVVNLNLNIVQSVTLPAAHLLMDYISILGWMWSVNDENKGRQPPPTIH